MSDPKDMLFRFLLDAVTQRAATLSGTLDPQLVRKKHMFLGPHPSQSPVPLNQHL